MNVRIPRKIIMGSIFLFCSHLSLAASQVPLGRTISNVATYSTFAIVYFSPTVSDSEGCTNSGQGRVRIVWSSDSDRKVMMASVLTAMVGGKDVGFGLVGCDGGDPVVYRVDMQN